MVRDKMSVRINH